MIELIILVSKIQKYGAKYPELLRFFLGHSQSLQMIHVSYPLEVEEQLPTKIFEDQIEEVLDEVKDLLSASQKHGAECPESRFVL